MTDEFLLFIFFFFLNKNVLLSIRSKLNSPSGDADLEERRKRFESVDEDNDVPSAVGVVRSVRTEIAWEDNALSYTYKEARESINVCE